ncbi:MAG: hypothetical protein NTX28_11355 [Novosphingobium sp.]|nr:hypothetical protein [Novosphingobium sp.]
MRKIALVSLAALAFAAAPAHAQSTSTGTVDVTGAVAGRCLFTVPNGSIEIDELALSGTDSNAGRLNTAKVNARAATLNGWCNAAAATIKVEAQPLLNPAAATDAAFTNRIDFTASAAAKDVTATDTSFDDAAGDEENVGLFSGDVVVTLSNSSANQKLLVAGSYTGSVLVTLAPNI